MLKNAPVEGEFTENVKVKFQPLGIELRNIRCLRCGEWGHRSIDRECKLRDQNPNGKLERVRSGFVATNCHTVVKAAIVFVFGAIEGSFVHNRAGVAVSVAS